MRPGLGSNDPVDPSAGQNLGQSPNQSPSSAITQQPGRSPASTAGQQSNQASSVTNPQQSSQSADQSADQTVGQSQGQLRASTSGQTQVQSLGPLGDQSESSEDEGTDDRSLKDSLKDSSKDSKKDERNQKAGSISDDEGKSRKKSDKLKNKALPPSLFRDWRQEGHPDTATMSDNSVMAPKFSGRSAEDSEEFLRDFKAYVVYKQLRPSQAYSLLGIILKDKARDFFISFDKQMSGVVTEKDVEKFLKEMVAHFKTQQTMWSQGTQLLDVKQQPSETFEEFVIRVQRLGRKVGVDEEKIRMFIIHGARADIRHSLLLTGATLSIGEMERVAQLVETAKEGQDQSLAQAIKRVELKVDAMNVLAATADRESREEVAQGFTGGVDQGPPRPGPPRQQARRSWAGQRGGGQGWSNQNSPQQTYQRSNNWQYDGAQGQGARASGTSTLAHTRGHSRTCSGVVGWRRR